MTANGIQSINRLPRLFFKLFTWGIMGFVCAQTAYAVPVDIKSYDPASGVVRMNVLDTEWMAGIEPSAHSKLQ